jgi:hypothetical protein
MQARGERKQNGTFLHSSSFRSTFMHRIYSVCRLPESICPEHVQDAYQTISLLVKHMLCSSLTNQQQQLQMCTEYWFQFSQKLETCAIRFRTPANVCGACSFGWWLMSGAGLF